MYDIKKNKITALDCKRKIIKIKKLFVDRNNKRTFFLNMLEKYRALKKKNKTKAILDKPDNIGKYYQAN